MDQVRQFEDRLSSLAVISSTLDTIEAFPGDESLRECLMEMVEEARHMLVQWAKETSTHLEEGRIPGMENVKVVLLGLMEGSPIPDQTLRMIESIFGGPSVSFARIGSLDADQVRRLSSQEAGVRLWEDFLQLLNGGDNYADKRRFQERIIDRYNTLWLVQLLTLEA